ncbi:MAG: cyanophycinase [Gemmatimonadota bacterium]
MKGRARQHATVETASLHLASHHSRGARLIVGGPEPEVPLRPRIALIAGLFSTCIIAPAFGQAHEKPASTAGRGHLFIVGGGEQSAELVTRFVALAGGRGHARIAVVPMASEDAAGTGKEKADELEELGADVFVLNLNRAEAEGDSAAKLLGSATGIWFTGGDQIRLTRILLDTPVLRAMHLRYERGAVVGGTSAGAAIMPDSMLTGNQQPPGDSSGYYGDEYPLLARGVIEIVRGLGFLHGAIVDQHFIKRERHNRLLSVVLERPTLLGVGIDEGTALDVAPDGRWHVLGASAAIVYDARAGSVTPASASILGATGVRLNLLPAGSTFDPRTGRGALPSRRVPTGAP